MCIGSIQGLLSPFQHEKKKLCSVISIIILWFLLSNQETMETEVRRHWMNWKIFPSFAIHSEWRENRRPLLLKMDTELLRLYTMAFEITNPAIETFSLYKCSDINLWFTSLFTRMDIITHEVSAFNPHTHTHTLTDIYFYLHFFILYSGMSTYYRKLCIWVDSSKT